MGISFEPGGRVCWQFTFLRGYKPDEPGEGSGPARDALEQIAWTGEGAQAGGRETLGQILADSTGGLIALFGLDRATASSFRAAALTLPGVIDLSPPPCGVGRFRSAVEARDLYQRLAEICNLFDTTAVTLEGLRHMLNSCPPLVILFDLTGVRSPKDRRDFCAAVTEFRRGMESAAGKRHRVVVLLRHRHRFDADRAAVDPYLPDARAWMCFRTETGLPEASTLDDYPVRNRGESRPRDAGRLREQTLIPRLGIQRLLREQMLERGARPLFVVGRPGTGKSVLQQQLPDAFPGGEALVLCRGFDRSDGKWYVMPLLRSLCRGLLDRLGWEGDLPDGDDAARWQCFVRGLLHAVGAQPDAGPGHAGESADPANAAPDAARGRRVVIGIDALDEADPGERDRLDWLINTCLPHPLPPGVHIVCTARPETAKDLRIDPRR